MKLLLFSIIVIFSLKGYAQDSLKIKKIDSLINLINRSNFKVHKDSTKQDNPAIGISLQSYVTTIKKGTELKKYVCNTFGQIQQNGKTVHQVNTSTYYYDHNKVIKVEQYIKTGNTIQETEWYYADDKPISTPAIFNAKNLAEGILSSGKSVLKTVSE